MRYAITAVAVAACSSGGGDRAPLGSAAAAPAVVPIGAVDAAVDAAAAPVDAGDSFYAFLRDFCAAMDATDTAFVRDHVRFPLARHMLVNAEACSSANQPCRFRDVVFRGPAELIADRVCRHGGDGPFEERLPEANVKHVAATPKRHESWAVNEEIGQFGTWLWFERSAASYRLVRYSDDGAPP